MAGNAPLTFNSFFKMAKERRTWDKRYHKLGRIV